MITYLYHWQSANKALFILINNYINHFPLLASALNNLSKLFFIGNFAILYIITITLYFAHTKIKPNQHPPQEKQNTYSKFIKVGITYGLFGVFFAIIKFSINLPRPFCSLQAQEFITIMDISRERCLSSFPSAHSALAIILAYSAWPYINLKLKIFSVIIIIFVMISRISLAMHYPADIFYSILLAFLVIKVAHILYKITLPLSCKIIGYISEL